MPKPPDARAVAYTVHDLAERLINQGACPACLAQALVDEGFFLAQFAGELAVVREVAGRYSDQPLRMH